MRWLLRLTGNALFAAGVTGMVVFPAVLAWRAGLLGQNPAYAVARARNLAALAAGGTATPALQNAFPAATPFELPAPEPVVAGAAVPPEPELPITSLAIPSIGLGSVVETAPLVQLAGGTTWEVPAFKVGHGEGTAGAGAPGNAVLLGHVASLDAGNVFRDLSRVRAGDTVRLFSGEHAFDYRVFEVGTVPRTDLAPLAPTNDPVATLITCTGQWLPRLQDFSDRLVVRAALVTPNATGG